MRLVACALVVVSLLAAACGDRGAPPTPASARPPGPALSASALLALSAAPLVADAGASGASGAMDAGGSDGVTGSWDGTYDAKKSSIALPSKVKGDALGADDGKSVVGPGTVEIKVDATGELTGKIAGSLGPGTLTGRVEGGMLRASIRPDDPRAARAMTGVLIGVVKADAILCDLHAAGPDGGTIRESSVQLKRKP